MFLKRAFLLLLCLAILGSLLSLPALAFEVSYYNEEIYAGGVLDMMAFVGEGDLSGYTFQWQADAGMGDDHWYDLEDNAAYKGTDTNHLQLHTTYDGDYTDFDQIPFRCVITKNGVTKHTPNLYMHIRPSGDIVKVLKNKGMGLYEPSLSNVTGFSSKDDLTYTANAFAGSNIGIICGGSTESQISTLQNSEVQLKREIKITENGKYTVSGDKTSYIPYTVGNNAVKIELNMRIIMAGVDRGVYQTKTIYINTQKPAATAMGKAKSACSLLRYTYNESEKLASIAKGTNLEVIGKEGSYYQVYYNGYVGYVGASLLDVQSGDPLMIEHVELSMAEPAAGNIWPSSITVKPNSCFATSVEWFDKTTNKFMESGERFIKGHNYQLVVWVSAKEGYRFKLSSSNEMLTTAVLNGKYPCYTSRAYEQVIGKVIDIRYDFNNVQEAVASTTQPTQTPTQPTQTPTQPTQTPDQPQHTHTPSAWRTTGAYHYKACTTCGDFLEQEDHKGGVATCNEKGKCTVCGYAYIETNENHTPDTTKWVARGEMYHFHPCKGCGAHCDIADHIPGPAGTPGAAVVCRDCGYVITPAKNHEHKLTLVAEVEPTCTESGVNAYYTCSGCSEKFYDAQGAEKIADEEDLTIPPQGHHISNGWGFDEDTHWRICAWCKARMTETEMEHELQDGKCTTCEFEGTAPTQTAPVQTTDPETTAPAQTTEPETADPEPTNPESADPETEEGGLPLWALLLIGLVAVAAGVGGGILVLKLSKKKRV